VQFYAPIPHHLLGWKSNTSNFGTGIESQGIHVVMFVLLNRLRRVEEVVEQFLLPPELQLKFNVKTLLEADIRSQAEFFSKMRNISVYSADRILELLDEPPRGIPDDYLYPGNMTRIMVDGGETVPAGNGVRGQSTLSQGVITEARCPDCRNLLGRNVAAADLWCEKCKAQRSFRAVEVQPTAAKDRDSKDVVERMAEEIAARWF